MMRKGGIAALISLALCAAAHALPVTTFTVNSSGGFDATIYPTLADGTFTFESPVFSLPISVNAGYVIILTDPTLSSKDPSNWSDVIRFIDNGKGKAQTMQMFVGGPDQSSYFPPASKVLNNSHIFIPNASISNDGFTDFTDYSVSGKKSRTYHFYTAAISMPDTGSTLALFGLAIAAMFFFRRKLASA